MKRFRSFNILSHFSYCQFIWHFCSQVHTKKIDKGQFRALRFILMTLNPCTVIYELRLTALYCILFIVYCLLTIHKTYNIYKGEEGLIKTIDTPPTIKMHTLKASLKMINLTELVS